MHHEGAISLVAKGLIVIALVVMNGFFVAAEFALVRIRETQLDALAATGHRRAKAAREVLARLNTYLSVTQLGVTLASLGLGWAGEPVFYALLAPVLDALRISSDTVRHTLAFTFGFSAITFLHITVGELTPKRLAIQKPLAIALWVAQPLRWFYLCSYPFNWVLNRTTQWLLLQMGLESSAEGERGHSEEELRLLFAATQRRSGGSVFGRDIVLNALDLRHRLARDVMRPRQEIVPFNTAASMAECLDLAEKTRYSRFPLCEHGDPDRTLGVVHIKDLYAMRIKGRNGADLLPTARKLIYVPETARLEKLLQLLLERQLHMAIVVDEYGSTTGMVTLENVLEELVGQIQDEFDAEKPLLVKVAEGTWEIAGALPLHQLTELVEQPLQEEGVVTVSGFVTQRLGGFPKAGDRLTLGNFDLRVEAMDGMKVAQLKLTRRVGAESAAISPVI